MNTFQQWKWLCLCEFHLSEQHNTPQTLEFNDKKGNLLCYSHSIDAISKVSTKRKLSIDKVYDGERHIMYHSIPLLRWWLYSNFFMNTSISASLSSSSSSFRVLMIMIVIFSSRNEKNIKVEHKNIWCLNYCWLYTTTQLTIIP